MGTEKVEGPGTFLIDGLVSDKWDRDLTKYRIIPSKYYKRKKQVLKHF